MTKRSSDNADAYCPAEIDVATEFPELYEFYGRHPVSRPDRAEIWERVLRVARKSKPVLDDARARGLNLVRLDQYTPDGIDRRPLYEAVIAWLPKIDDPLTLTICMGRLLEPGARSLVKKNGELLLSLARLWNDRLRGSDNENTLSPLAQCVMRAVVERDVPEVLGWVHDSGLSYEARYFYALDLQRFARKPGIARDALFALTQDAVVGSAAVWALSGALKTEVLSVVRRLRDSSPHESVRKAAATATKRLEARIKAKSRRG